MLTYAVVVETENLANGDLSDLEACLDSIAAQRVSPPPSALIVVNSGQVAPTLLDELRTRYSGLTVHTTPHPLHYYAAKLEGARVAPADVVVFADSDLRYDEGWLAALLEPFASPAVAFVTGETRVAITGPYTFSVATTWLFPRRYSPGPAPSLIANNCAVRRDALLACPFPAAVPLYRAQITLHGRALRQRGLPIVRVAARGWHAPPAGWREWALRYVVAGADSVAAGTWDSTAGGDLLQRDSVRRRAQAWGTSVARKVASSFVRTLQAWAERPSTLAWAPIALPISFAGLLLFAIGGLTAVGGSTIAMDRMRAFEARAGGVR